jgi:thiamine-phosphate pyrophosphorylase
VVRRIRERVCGLKPLKRLVYLISPNKIEQNFYTSLDKVLSYKNVKFFQIRLKNVSQKKLINISDKIRKITAKHKVKFIINDNYTLISKIKANGCHMGQQDGSFKIARKKLKGKILGITCHNSKILANQAIERNADYIAFGSFFKSRLKPSAKKANLDILKWAKKNIKKPIVAIGGINNINYRKLMIAGAKYIALSSFIWDNPKLKPEQAIKRFK